MNIQRALLTLIVCCVCTTPMSAQTNRSRARAKPAMWAALQLTETQKTQVNAIHDKYAPSMKVAKKETGDSASKIHDREMSEVRAVLTISQQQTFDSYMNAGRRTRRGSVAKVVPAKIAVPR